MADIELSPEQAAALMDALEATDRKNASIGVTGPEVALYTLREMNLRQAERRLLDANVECRRLQREHEEHPVTVKIRSYQRTHKDASND